MKGVKVEAEEVKEYKRGYLTDHEMDGYTDKAREQIARIMATEKIRGLVFFALNEEGKCDCILLGPLKFHAFAAEELAKKADPSIPAFPVSPHEIN